MSRSLALAWFAALSMACSVEADQLPEATEGADIAATHPVTFTQNSYGITFSNGDGDWTIYTGCFGPHARGGTDLTVGPGYIARLVLPRAAADGSRTIVDDERPLWGDGTPRTAGTLSSPGHGGLGAFGWHHARGPGQFELNTSDAWEITGRECAEDNGQFGVSSATVFEAPRIDTSGVGHLGIDVFFTDRWTYPTPIVRVRYRYEVHPSVVQMWALVTEHCANGECGASNGAPGPAYLEEPKFLSAIVAGGYTRMAILDHAGNVAANSVSNNTDCIWRGINPQRATGQCDADDRVRARFDYGDATSGAGGGCDTTSHFCLNTVMRAYRHLSGDDVVPGLASDDWENGVYGLDGWAVASEGRTAVNTTDSPGGGAQWGCYGGNTTAQKERRWEMAAWGSTPGALSAAGFGFHAWEGGTGGYDCEPLSRRFGPEGEHFAVHAEYSVNAGWDLN